MNEELAEYIKKCMDQGYAREDIITQLRSSGYEDNTINDAMNSLTNQLHHINSPSPTVINTPKDKPKKNMAFLVTLIIIPVIIAIALVSIFIFSDEPDGTGSTIIGNDNLDSENETFDDPEELIADLTSVLAQMKKCGPENKDTEYCIDFSNCIMDEIEEIIPEDKLISLYEKHKDKEPSELSQIIMKEYLQEEEDMDTMLEIVMKCAENIPEDEETPEAVKEGSASTLEEKVTEDLFNLYKDMFGEELAENISKCTYKGISAVISEDELEEMYSEGENIDEFLENHEKGSEIAQEVMECFTAVEGLMAEQIQNSSRFIPEKCEIAPGLTCLDFNAKASADNKTVIILMNNGIGQTLRQVLMTLPDCGGADHDIIEAIEHGVTEKFLIDCPNANPNEKFQSDIILEYDVIIDGNTLTHSKQGSISVTVEELNI